MVRGRYLQLGAKAGREKGGDGVEGRVEGREEEGLGVGLVAREVPDAEEERVEGQLRRRRGREVCAGGIEAHRMFPSSPPVTQY